MHTQPTDLYAVLGVSPDASTAQLSHAYRELLRQHHPDTRTVEQARQAASDVALQQILSAYAVLGDADRRAEYDSRTGSQAPQSATPEPAPSTPPRASHTGQPLIQAGPVRWHTGPGSTGAPTSNFDRSYPPIRLIQWGPPGGSIFIIGDLRR